MSIRTIINKNGQVVTVLTWRWKYHAGQLNAGQYYYYQQNIEEIYDFGSCERNWKCLPIRLNRRWVPENFGTSQIWYIIKLL